jgi:hypothetical protein
MTTNQQHDPDGPSSRPARLSSEEIIRRLEEFPIEVLQAALLVLRERGKQAGA